MSRQRGRLPAAVTPTVLGVSNLLFGTWSHTVQYWNVTQGTGTLGLQSPNTLMDASVTFVDDCFVELRITGWGAKGNYGSLIQEEEGPRSVFRYSSGID